MVFRRIIKVLLALSIIAMLIGLISGASGGVMLTLFVVVAMLTSLVEVMNDKK